MELRANHDFRVVLAGQAVSALGDAVSITAMPLLVLALTGSGALMGTIAALQFLPDLLFGVLAGALADRWDRTRMMRWSDAGRALLTATIPVSYWLGWSTIAVIVIVIVPINMLRLLSDAGFTSAIPSLVGRENLARANSYMEAALSVPFIVGPAMAGVLVATIGAAPTLAVDAVSFALSSASLAFVRRPMRADRGPETPRILADIKAGIAFVRHHPLLRTIIGYWSVVAIATAATVPTLSYYITIDRALGAELFGFVGSTWSLGYLIGSLMAGRFKRDRVGLRMLATGLVIGTQLVAIAVAASPIVYLASAFLIGAALAVLLVSYATLRAAATPDELLGRVGSLARTISLGLQPVTLLAAGALIQTTSAGVALAAMGCLSVLASTLFALSRTFRSARV